ncbi:MAG: RsbRD N-terminal domain-containing protein [Candidatus Kapaibacterium sp.]
MKFEKFLIEKRSAILDKWFDLIIDTYPGESGRFFSNKDAEFTNPVGHTIARDTERLYDAIIKGADAAEISDCMEEIIRIRAVQEFSPSQAAGFVFLLKQAARKEWHKSGAEDTEALLEFEDAVDFCSMIAFDLYMKKREKLYEIKANEIRKRNGRIVDRLNRKYEFLDPRLGLGGEEGLPEN